MACGAMPPKNKGTWVPKGALPDPRWITAAAGRLDNVRAGLADSSLQGLPPPPRPQDVEPTATSSWGREYQERRKTGVKERGQPETPAQELAALRLGRTVPASFNPQRHAVMVCGRPVVVPLICQHMQRMEFFTS